MRRGVIGLLLGFVAVGGSAATIEATMSEFQLVELANTFTDQKIDRLLPPSADWLEHNDRAAVAVMLAVGLIEKSSVQNATSLAQSLDRAVSEVGGTKDEFRVPLDDVSPLMRLAQFGGQGTLRQATELTESLDQAIAKGVLTGYGLRRPHVSAVTDPQRTVIYSHSSLPHVKQLVGLVASEGLKGRVYIAPKIAAFVFREGWGERPEWINELSPELYVAQGPEMLVHFEFERASDRIRFDELVTQYAKKDTEAETGNLMRAWWQPFYYGETPVQGYHEIHRVTLFAEQAEASLLMLPERTEIVRHHFEDMTWKMQADSIWVSAPFYRFLQGDYK
ncbi:MAG: hypothetical protein HOH58_02825 [Opitutaceae bacterium]|jgi:hypothetical protein|nr:hypothetical protein [Opitutaceae bacterium]